MIDGIKKNHYIKVFELNFYFVWICLRRFIMACIPTSTHYVVILSTTWEICSHRFHIIEICDVAYLKKQTQTLKMLSFLVASRIFKIKPITEEPDQKAQNLILSWIVHVQQMVVTSCMLFGASCTPQHLCVDKIILNDWVKC